MDDHEREKLRLLLAGNLPYSPLDFIPGISRAGDREIFVERLTAPIEPSDDLRFIAETGEGPFAIFCQRLPWDSQFFQREFARLDAVVPLGAPWHRPRGEVRPALDKLLRRSRERGIEYLLAVVDPRDVALLRGLGAAGFSLIETRSYFYGPVRVGDLSKRALVRRAEPADVPSLADAAIAAENPYDRFRADPFFAPAEVARLFAEWLKESVAGRMADLVVVPDVEAPQAFVTYRYHRSSWARWGLPIGQGVLSAATPEFAGWLPAASAEINYHLYRAGVRYLYGTTQVTNREVAWLAEDAGARFGRCEHVFRLIL